MKKVRLEVKDEAGRQDSFEVQAWKSVKDLKEILRDRFVGYPASRQRLFVSSRELRNTRRMHELGPPDADGPVRVYMSLAQPPGQSGTRMLRTYGNVPCPDALKDIMRDAFTGMIRGLKPKLTIEGTGGTYLMKETRGDVVAVFKPADEEQFAPNNPRKHVGRMGSQGFRKGILSGEGYLREAAAYLLDSTSGGHAGVPMTTLAEAQYEDAFHYPGKGFGMSASADAKRPKIGSIQEFIDSDEVADNFASRIFPVSEVHKIAILDIRIANTDRNAANILVCECPPVRGARDSKKTRKELIPIDHAYSLPDTIEIDELDWCWHSWPQTSIPLDAAMRAHVESLDIDADIERLRSTLGIREPCLRTMRITGMLLKMGVKHGLTLAQIANIICRRDDNPSKLEIMCEQAYRLAKARLSRERRDRGRVPARRTRGTRRARGGDQAKAKKKDAKERTGVDAPAVSQLSKTGSSDDELGDGAPLAPRADAAEPSENSGSSNVRETVPELPKLLRSISFTNFGAIQSKAIVNGFGVAQLDAPLGNPRLSRRLSDRSWSQDTRIKSKEDTDADSKACDHLPSLSAAFFDALRKLIKQRIEITKCASNSVAEGIKKAASTLQGTSPSPWYATVKPRRASQRSVRQTTAVSGDSPPSLPTAAPSTLSFQKSKVVPLPHNGSPFSLMANTFSDILPGKPQFRGQVNNSPRDASPVWEATTHSSSVDESPRARSSADESDSSRLSSRLDSESTQEDGKSRLRASPTVEHKFMNPTNRFLSTLAPPLTNGLKNLGGQLTRGASTPLETPPRTSRPTPKLSSSLSPSILLRSSAKPVPPRTLTIGQAADPASAKRAARDAKVLSQSLPKAGVWIPRWKRRRNATGIATPASGAVLSNVAPSSRPVVNGLHGFMPGGSEGVGTNSRESNQPRRIVGGFS